MALGKKTGGRVAGTPNVAGRSVKAIFEDVFHLLQEDQKANLRVWAAENPTDYYKLSAKLIPAAVEHAGKDGGPIQLVNILNSLDGTSADLPTDE